LIFLAAHTTNICHFPLGKHTLRKLVWSGWPTCFYSERHGIEPMLKYLLFCGIFLYFHLALSSMFFF
jgi:hypothetical protein